MNIKKNYKYDFDVKYSGEVSFENGKYHVYIDNDGDFRYDEKNIGNLDSVEIEKELKNYILRQIQEDPFPWIQEAPDNRFDLFAR